MLKPESAISTWQDDRRDGAGAPAATGTDVEHDTQPVVIDDRAAHIKSICAAADLRDDHAEVRDFLARQRDIAANLEAFAQGIDDTAAFESRELAHRDRLRAKADRVAAELDRYLLSDMQGCSADTWKAQTPRRRG